MSGEGIIRSAPEEMTNQVIVDEIMMGQLSFYEPTPFPDLLPDDGRMMEEFYENFLAVLIIVCIAAAAYWTYVAATTM